MTEVVPVDIPFRYIFRFEPSYVAQMYPQVLVPSEVELVTL